MLAPLMSDSAIVQLKMMHLDGSGSHVMHHRTLRCPLFRPACVDHSYIPKIAAETEKDSRKAKAQILMHALALSHYPILTP